MGCNLLSLDTDVRVSFKAAAQNQARHVTSDGLPLNKVRLTVFIYLQIPTDPPQKHRLSGNDSRHQSWCACKSATTCTTISCLGLLNLKSECRCCCFRLRVKTRHLYLERRVFLKPDPRQFLAGSAIRLVRPEHCFILRSRLVRKSWLMFDDSSSATRYPAGSEGFKEHAVI